MRHNEESAKSLRANFLGTVQRHPERPAISYVVDGASGHRPQRQWHTLSWHEYALLVVEVAGRLDELCPSDAIVSVLASTDARYPVLEHAVIVSGRRLQPLYTTTPDDELVRAIAATGAGVLVARRDQWARTQTGPLAEHRQRRSVSVVELDHLVRLPNTGQRPAGLLGADTEPFDTRAVRAKLSEWTERCEDDAVLYLQSTGTTGPAQVIEISQKALLAAIAALPDDVMNPHPVLLSFLPTAHISERLLVGQLSVVLAAHTWFGGGPETLAEDLLRCKPTVFLAPPLVLDAIRGEATAQTSASRMGRLLLRSVAADAERTGRRAVTGAAARRLGTRLFGWSVRRKAGLNRARIAIAGTAPLPPDLRSWWETVGLRLRNVYGQSEMSGSTSLTLPAGSIRGAVGRPLPGVEIKVADDGELLVRSPSMFTRYVGDEQKTARAFDSGWFKTGDRARLGEDGSLILLGRIQSLVPVPGGGVADLGDLTRQITSALGAADVAYHRTDEGVYLYVAVHPAGIPHHVLIDGDLLDPVSPAHPQSKVVYAQLKTSPSGSAIVAVAVFRGAFRLRTGEVGPTGKPRGWRIHQLHSGDTVRYSIAMASDTTPRTVAAIA